MRLPVFVSCFLCSIVVSCQIPTSPLALSQNAISDTDMNRPGAGLEQWNGQYVVNTGYQPLDIYYRFSYADIAPYDKPAGTYDFALFDSKINEAISKNQKFSFCIMQMCGICSQGGPVDGTHLYYPLYLHALMQAEPVKDFKSGGQWVPIYNSSSWLKAWTELNAVVNKHIMQGSFNHVPYKNVIGYIDVSGYGDYGEWTNNSFTGPPGSVASEPTLKTIIDATVQGYSDFQCVALVATFDGNQLDNTRIPPPVGYYALTTSNKKGRLGWRRDNWGWTDNYNARWTNANPTVFNNMRFDTAIMNRYKEAPVVGEPADLGNAGIQGLPFAALPGQIKYYHVSSFGNGNLDKSRNDTNALNNFRIASRGAGYRLILTGGSMRTTLSGGGNFNIIVNWQNIGVAPTYEDWTVVYELRTSDGAVAWTGNSAFNPRLFLPSETATAVSDSFTIDESVSNGSYSLFMIIKDPLGYRKPLPLAMKGANADGSYLIRSNIQVE